jgi:hypothetical protein
MEGTARALQNRDFGVKFLLIPIRKADVSGGIHAGGVLAGQPSILLGGLAHNDGETGQGVPDVDSQVVRKGGFPRGVRWQVCVLLSAEASWR